MNEFPENPKELRLSKPEMSDQSDKEQESQVSNSKESVGQRAKNKMRELSRHLDKKYGPGSIHSELSEGDKKLAQQARIAGQGLDGTYQRVDEAEMARQVGAAVKIALELTKPNLVNEVSRIMTSLFWGVAGNVTWDILKHFVPYLHTAFGSKAQTNLMDRSQKAYEEIRDQAPPEFKNFDDEYRHGLLALRAETWQALGEELKATEVGKKLTDGDIRLILENLEGRFFVPVRS